MILAHVKIKGYPMDLYKLRREAFKSEIAEYSRLVETSLHLAVAGMSKVGVANVLRLIAEIIRQDYKHVLIVDGVSPSAANLESFENMSGSRLIVVPNYTERDSEFKQNLQRLVQGGSGRRIHTLIGISVQDYIDLAETFNISSKLYTSTRILKPRNRAETKLLIREHFTGLTATEMQYISRISGGNPGLIKRCFNITTTDKKVTVKALLSDKATVFTLSKLVDEMRIVSPAELQDFGYVDSSGNIFSRLLKEYVGDSVSLSTPSLVGKLAELFLSAKGTLVTHSQIDEIVEKYGAGTAWSKYKAIERAKDQVKDKLVLINVRGKGYIAR